MSGRRARGWRALALLAAALAEPLAALEVPFLSGRVVDLAGLLTESEKQSIEQKLAAFEQKTGAQIAVLTLPSLEGEPLEDYSMRVVETWKLGRAGADDGALLLVARDDPDGSAARVRWRFTTPGSTIAYPSSGLSSRMRLSRASTSSTPPVAT